MVCDTVMTRLVNMTAVGCHLPSATRDMKLLIFFVVVRHRRDLGLT